jgi:hypothetical protein
MLKVELVVKLIYDIIEGGAHGRANLIILKVEFWLS